MFYTLANALTNWPNAAGMFLFAGIAALIYFKLEKR